MTILITGGAGYVGSRLANSLCLAGIDVVVVDTMTYGCPNFHSGLTLLECDIRDLRTLKSTSGAVPDCVIHLAAISNDPTGDLNPDLTWDINLEGTRHLLHLAQEAKVPRFVFASSSSVMGVQSGVADEATSPNPITAYSQSKLAAEKEVLALDPLDMTTVVIRPATVCGVSPRQRLDLAVNAMVASAVLKGQVTVHGGDQRRPHIAIEDMVRLYTLLPNLPAADIAGEVFHAGWDNQTIKETGTNICRLVRAAGIPCQLFVDSSVSDPRDYHISAVKIEQKLAFIPRFGPEDAAARLCDHIITGFITDPEDPSYHNLKMLTRADDSLSR